MDSNSPLTSKQQIISEKVSNYFGSYTRPQNFPFFTMKNLQEAFKEMKEYYNDITKENLELIKMHKEKLVDIRAQIEAN
jgi:hypothetical protein